VAGEGNDSGGRAEGASEEPGSHEPRECMACRGSGRVISNLGGAASTLECPWCAGSGERVPGIDAQERWLAQAARSPGEDAREA